MEIEDVKIEPIFPAGFLVSLPAKNKTEANAILDEVIDYLGLSGDLILGARLIKMKNRWDLKLEVPARPGLEEAIKLAIRKTLKSSS